MRKKMINALFVIYLFLSFPLFAQDTSKSFYFPHKTGDIWEYFYDTGSSYPPDTFQILTVFDSTDSQGIIHITQYSRFINPILYPSTQKYWIDTVNNFIYGQGERTDSVLIIKLNAKNGDVWIVNENYSSDNIAKVNNKWEGTIFDKATTFMEIGYYKTNDINDSTTWLHLSSKIIADGYGVVYMGGGDLFAEYNLIGAKINDTLYGNITPVSVKNKDYLPSKIKLNQNYPNPFNPSTTISFELSRLTKVSLIIYNVLGKEVYRIIDNQELKGGEHKVVWNGLTSDGNSAASGIYFFRLVADEQIFSRSMILLK